MNLYDFLSSTARNAWIEHGELSVYVRRAFHSLGNGEVVDTFDIANIDLPEELRGQGIFKRFLAEVALALQNTPIRVIYIENVLNERFAESLRKYGLIEINDRFISSWPPSFYLRLP